MQLSALAVSFDEENKRKKIHWVNEFRKVFAFQLGRQYVNAEST